MRSWGHFVGLLGPNFNKIMRKEGLVRALLRGKIYKYNQEKAGWDDVARLVGTDQFGNRYYEDFTHHNKNTRRWVEYADYGKWWLTGKTIAPGWQGWMHYVYDDPPRKENFVEPYYRPHRTQVFRSDHPTLSYFGPGHLMNKNKQKFAEMQRARMFTDWTPPVGNTNKQGKKIVTRRRSLSQEILMNL